MRRIITCAVAGLVLLVFSGEIIAAPAPQPDLIMTTVAYAASANAGRNVNVTNTVQNTGNLDTATSFYVRFYLSTNNTIGGGDINLGQRLISGGLLISETDTAVSAVTIPAGTAPGTYYIIARADATGVVPESDNTNNDLAGNQITITLYVPTSTFLGGGCTSGSGGGEGGTGLAAFALAGATVLVLRSRARRNPHLCSLSRPPESSEGVQFRCHWERDGVRDTRPAATAAGVALAVLVPLAFAGCGALALPAAPLPADRPVPFLPEPALVERLPGLLPARNGKSVIGARAGLLMPGGADDNAYLTSITLGAFYPGRLPKLMGLEGVPFEAGLDIAWSESSNGDRTASLALIRFDCLLSKWRQLGSKPELYGLVGYQVVGDSGSGESSSSLNLGGGFMWPGKGWDARLTWSILIGSGNVGDMVLMTAGYTF